MVVSTCRSHGAIVRIHDDCLVLRGTSEEREVVEDQRRIAHKILMTYAREGNNDETRTCNPDVWRYGTG